MNFISIKGLKFKYQEEDRCVLNDISLEVGNGEFLTILGENGSGKSTLVTLLNGLLLPTEGDVYIDGVNTKSDSYEDIFKIKSKVGLVFQNPENQIITTIVEEEVAFGPENLGLDVEIIKKRVESSLKKVGLYDSKDKSIHTLSGGQKQKLAIASVLAMNPKCIVFDESTSMLDPSDKEGILNIMKELNKSENITIILITHNIEEVLISKKTLVIKDGKISFLGNPRKLLGQSNNIGNLGIFLPEEVELVKKLKAEKVGIKGNVVTFDECKKAIVDILGG